MYQRLSHNMPKLTKDQFEAIVNTFEDAGYETHSYSGRHMGGGQCLGVSCEDPVKTLLRTIAYLADRSEFAEDVSQFIKRLGPHNIDSLGRNTILYFHTVVWQGE